MRVILIGGGKTVYFLGKKFATRHYHITIVNRKREHCQFFAEHLKATVVFGDGSKPNVLEEAGARRADVVLALTPNDQDNLIACQIAAKFYGVPRTVALVNDPENEEIFHKLGVSAVFSATQMIASLIEQKADFEDVKSLLSLAEGHVTITDVRLRRDAPVIGKSLSDLTLGDDILIACIIRDDEMLIPRGTSRLAVNDHLLIIGRPEAMKAALEQLTGEVAEE